MSSRLLQDVTGAIRLTIYDQDGNARAADGAVTVTVYDGSGTESESGVASAVSGSTGVYEYSPSTATLDDYSAEWDFAVGGVAQEAWTYFEVTGGFFFTVAELRAFDTRLADTARFPTATVVDVREGVEADLEDACGVAFVPRADRVTMDGSGKVSLYLPHLHLRDVYSASVDDTALTAAELADLHLYDSGRVTRGAVEGGVWDLGTRNVELHYEHGHDRPPHRIKRAALILARSRLVPNLYDERAESMTTDEGSFNLAVPGRDGEFGIPEVDAAVAAWTEDIPTIA